MLLAGQAVAICGEMGGFFFCCCEEAEVDNVTAAEEVIVDDKGSVTEVTATGAEV